MLDHIYDLGQSKDARLSPSGFMPHDVSLVRRSESQAVIMGVKEGELVAMSNRDQQNKPAAGPKSAMRPPLTRKTPRLCYQEFEPLQTSGIVRSRIRRYIRTDRSRTKRKSSRRRSA